MDADNADVTYMRSDNDKFRCRPARVIDLELDWRQAAEAAAGLAVAAVALRTSGKPRLTRLAVFARETALALGLFALWQYAGSFAVMGPGGALGRSRWIWRFERAIHLPSETAIQRLFLPHPLLIQFFNLYYDSLHFPVLIACMAWLFVRHRDRYGRWRTTLVAFTGLCLAVQLIPVAPPRMLPSTGLVDTAVLYHESVYTSTVGFDPDQLSSMPSVHVGWALLVAVAVITSAKSRWRWLALLYPCMTTLVVIVTANHFWLDGIVAAAILALVLEVQAVARRIRATRCSQKRSGIPPASDGSDGLIIDLDAERLSEHRRHVGQLAGADDRPAQRVGVDDQAELSGSEVGPVHRDFAQVGPDKLRAWKRAPLQCRARKIGVAQNAILEDHLGEAGRPEVHRVQLAAAEHDIAQLGAEDLHPGQR
jgi:PAP2 superfamily